VDPFVHPQALCESHDIGSGTRIWAFAHVMNGVHIGAECNIGGHVFIEDGAWIGDRVTIKNGVLVWRGVRIDDDAFIGPGVIFTNDLRPRSPRMANAAVARRYSAGWLAQTQVGQGASVGAGAVILPGLTIGEYAFVAAGAVVTRDVASHALVMGNPARKKGYVCACGTKLTTKRGMLVCACGRKYHRIARGLIGS
jgi:UDP-2-acetamido-3-amino-2,3-dideoxy-glucuronate N-acetyltransferase